MKKILLILLCALAFSSCSKKDNSANTKTNSEQNNIQTAEQQPATTPSAAAEQLHGVLNDTNVNVRAEPSVDSAKVGKAQPRQIYKILGFSQNTDTFEDTTAPWAHVQLQFSEQNGWIFSKYLDIYKVVKAKNPRPLEKVTDFYITDINPPHDYRVFTVTVAFTDTNFEPITKVSPSQMAYQDFLTFHISGNSERLPPNVKSGLYAWYPEKNEIFLVVSDIPHLGVAWGIVSNDFNYLFADEGSAPGPREIYVYDLRTNECIYNGVYAGDIEYDGGDEITVMQTTKTEEDLQRIKEFEAVTPLTPQQIYDRKMGLGVITIVEYRYNFVTNTKTFKRCRRISVQ